MRPCWDTLETGYIHHMLLWRMKIVGNGVSSLPRREWSQGQCGNCAWSMSPGQQHEREGLGDSSSLERETAGNHHAR